MKYNYCLLDDCWSANVFVKYGYIFSEIESKNAFINKPIQKDQLDCFIRKSFEDLKSFNKMINSTFESKFDLDNKR